MEIIMALGDSSPFAPIDLLGGLVANVVATNFACQNYDFRTGISVTTKNAQGQDVKEVPAYLDYRFLGGLAAAVGGQLTNNAMARRVGHDVASGLLNSFVATETCRRHALERVSQQEWASQDGPRASQNRLTDDQAMQGVHAGAPNYAYGW
jgi:hypothetical protein